MNVAGYTVLIVEDDSNDALLIPRAFRNASVLNPLQMVRSLHIFQESCHHRL